jgi:hypothetical protein
VQLLPAPHFPFLPVVQASLPVAQAYLLVAQASRPAAQVSLPAAQVSLVTRGPHQRLLAPLLSRVLALGEAVYLLEVLPHQ